MIYKTFQGKSLSALGLGTMRLPVHEDKSIHKEMTAQMIDYAMKNGINYFDTAWAYHSGESERVLGEILAQYPRDSFYLATKFPGYDLNFFAKKEEIFQTQLEKCHVDYFDFYLCHNVCERNVDAYFDDSIGMFPFLLEQKAAGKIRHLGFSAHGELPVLKRFLEAYGEHLEFCQLQVNYLDWTWQKADEKIALMREYGIPVWVMEPLRGGSLVRVNDTQSAKLSQIQENASPAALAFRFLQSIPEVTMILSGMSDLQQLEENIKTFSCDSPLNEQQFASLVTLGRDMIERVPCTACRYCTEYCPQQLDIPKLLRLYNENQFSGASFTLNSLPPEKRPSACLACRQCEAVCPQGIHISEHFKELKKAEKPYSGS